METKKPNPIEVVITIEGGVIQEVTIPKGTGIVVKVMDFDTGDATFDRIFIDALADVKTKVDAATAANRANGQVEDL